MATLTALSIEDLAITRGERVIFEAFTLAVRAGEAVAVGGANGAGKTSLLRAVAGFLRPAAGAVRFTGDDGGELDNHIARRAHCHVIGHDDGLTEARTARQELLFAAGWAGGGDAAALAAADRLGLTRLLGRPVRKLSAGQRRRLSLARLIAAPRALWLLDEPFTALDAAGRALLAEAMAKHLSAGGLILVATHDTIPVKARSVVIGG